MYSSSDSDIDSTKHDVVIVDTIHRGSCVSSSSSKPSPPKSFIRKAPRVPKRSVSPMANHPTFVRLKREREIEEKDTEEDSSFPTSKKYRSETFTRRFGTLSLNDQEAASRLRAKNIPQPLDSELLLDIGNDDSCSDDEEESAQSGGSCGGRMISNNDDDDPYTIHQFEKFQKRHQHSLSSSPLHKTSSTLSPTSKTVTTITISDDKLAPPTRLKSTPMTATAATTTITTTVTTMTTLSDDDDDDDDSDECDGNDNDDTMDETRQSSGFNSSCSSSCSGNGSCTGSDR